MVYYTRINLNISALIHGVRAALTWQLTSFSDSLLQLVVPSLAKTRRHSIMITFKVYFLLVHISPPPIIASKKKEKVNTEIAKMEIGFASVANGSKLENYNSKNSLSSFKDFLDQIEKIK